MTEDKLPAHQAKAGRARWAKVPPEQRKAIMAELARKPRKKRLPKEILGFPVVEAKMSKQEAEKWGWKAGPAYWTNSPDKDKP